MTQQPEHKTPYLDLYECIALYPRLAASLAYAGYSLTEAGAAIRDYRQGMNVSSEAICHTGGTTRAISQAYRLRAYAQQYQDPEGFTRTTIARYRAEHRITKAAAADRERKWAEEEAARRQRQLDEYNARVAYYDLIRARETTTSPN